MKKAIVDIRTCVEDGRGIWVGIQECLFPPETGIVCYNLVLFNSPKTGSTLTLKANEITAELVRTHIAASDKKFQKTRKS